MTEKNGLIKVPEIQYEDLYYLGGQCPEFMPENVAMVTGTSGIAEAVILTLLRNYISVVACDIEKKNIQILQEKAERMGLARNLMMKELDLCNYDARVAFFDFAKKQGRIVKLFNVAGVQQIHRMGDFPWEEVEMMVDLMQLAPFHLSQMVLKEAEKNASEMPKFEGRRVRVAIVNISSIHSEEIPPCKSVYGMVKGALDMIGNAINSEGPEYCARAVNFRPGYVETELVKGQIDKTAKERGIPVERVVPDVMMKHCRTDHMMSTATVARHIVFASSSLSADMMGKYTIDNAFGTTYR